MIVIERTVDLSKPISTETLRGNEFTGEQLAHQFRISVTQSGEAVALTGTVTGKMLQANGNGLLLTGSVSDGVAVLNLVQACYGVPGRFHLAIYHSVTSGGTTETTCIYSAVGSVVNATGNPEYDPGDAIGDITQLITEANNASTTANNAATAAQNALTQATAVVSYADQSSEAHTDAQKAQARTNIGAANADMLTTRSMTIPSEVWDNGYFNSTNGQSSTASGWRRTLYNVQSYSLDHAGQTTYNITPTTGYRAVAAWFSARPLYANNATNSDTFIAAYSGAVDETIHVTVPEGAYLAISTNTSSVMPTVTVTSTYTDRLAEIRKALLVPIYPTMYILTASLNTLAVSITRENMRTVYFRCLPNTTYKITRAAGSRFVVAESPETSLSVSTSSVTVPIYNVIRNDAATEIIYTTSSTANTLAAFVWYEDEDSSTISAAEMCGSVRAYQMGNHAAPQDAYESWILTDSDGHEVYGRHNYAFRRFVRRPNGLSCQSVLYNDHWLYIFCGKAVRAFTPSSTGITNSVTQFDHVMGAEMLSDGTMLVTTASDYNTASETRGVYYYDFATNTITDSFIPTVSGSLVYASMYATGKFYLITWVDESNNLHFWDYNRSTDTATEIGSGVVLPRKFFQGGCRVGNLWYMSTNGGASQTPLVVVYTADTLEVVDTITLVGWGEPEGFHVVPRDDGGVSAYFVDNTSDNVYEIRLN